MKIASDQGGRCRIRTCVGVSRRIYSPLPLAARATCLVRVARGHRGCTRDETPTDLRIEIHFLQRSPALLAENHDLRRRGIVQTSRNERGGDPMADSSFDVVSKVDR